MLCFYGWDKMQAQYASTGRRLVWPATFSNPCESIPVLVFRSSRRVWKRASLENVDVPRHMDLAPIPTANGGAFRYPRFLPVLQCGSTCNRHWTSAFRSGAAATVKSAWLLPVHGSRKQLLGLPPSRTLRILSRNELLPPVISMLARQRPNGNNGA